MNTCNPSCVDNAPSVGWRNDCEITTRKGGIPFLLFYKCDPDATFDVDTGELSPWSSLENVRQAICQLNLFATAEPEMAEKGRALENVVHAIGDWAERWIEQDTH